MFPSALAAVQAATGTTPAGNAGYCCADQDHVGEVIVEPGTRWRRGNMASRIESFAVPGGVMLSDAARDQLNRTDVSLVSLSRFKLKNVGARSAVRSIGRWHRRPRPPGPRGQGRAVRQPPRQAAESATVARPGRRHGALVGMLRDHRVVCVTGPGGVGRTRLIVEPVGLAPEFLDGTLCHSPTSGC
jgi:hypothetical protein